MAALVLAASPASAQHRIDAWTTEHGLPQNSVNAVRQTRDGFIWISTFGGLVRFDGVSFKVYTPATTPGLRTSRFTDLFEARDGALWISTDGLGLVRYHQDRFATYTVADGLPDDRVYHVFQDRAGRVVAETLNGLAEWRDGRFGPSALAYPHGNGVTILGRSAAGVVWYRDRDGATHRYEEGRPRRAVALPKAAMQVFEDRSGRIWMKTGGQSIAMIALGAEARSAKAADGRLVTYTARDGIPSFGVMSATEDRDGAIWFGLGGGGGVLQIRDGRLTRYTTADGLPSDRVGPIFQDREGTIWVATEVGLARLTARPMTTFSTADGLEVANTYPIFQDRRGDIWIGGWQGLTRYAGGRFERLSASYGLSGQNILSILEDRDGALWLGRWGYGVRRIKDGRQTDYAATDGPGAIVRAIHQGRGPEIWFGAPRGLSSYRDGRFRLFAREDGYTGGEVFVIHEDRRGTLWVGTATGLTRYERGAFTHFAEKDGIAGPVRAIYEDREGTLWLGTYDAGLFRYRDGRFARYTTDQGLPTNGAFQIIEDDEARFWITSNSGIYRVARHDLGEVAAGRLRRVTAVPYGRRDGLLDPECNGGGQPAGIRARDGRVWFPTQKGVVVFDPARMPVQTTPPPVVITDLRIGDRPEALRDSFEIRSGSSTVEVQYAALTFFRPELSTFRYRMEGLDADWVDAGPQRSARYAQLPYGSFRFRVIAANRDGAWNEEGASFAIVVVRPFWRTRWFGALMALAAAVIAVGVHRWRMGLLRQQKALGEAFSRELIETQEEERRRVAAGLHDSLSQTLMLMKNWAIIGQSTLPADHRARAPLNDISVAASHALAEVREISYNLGPYQLERIGLVQTVTDLAEKVSSASGIRVTTHAVPIDGHLAAEQQIAAFRVVQEALNNVIKHSGATDASIVIRADPGAVRISIHDNGRGFDPAATSAAPSRKHGFGLLGMSERMRLAGGRFHVESSTTGGTLVELELPSTGASV